MIEDEWIAIFLTFCVFKTRKDAFMLEVSQTRSSFSASCGTEYNEIIPYSSQDEKVADYLFDLTDMQSHDHFRPRDLFQEEFPHL